MRDEALQYAANNWPIVPLWAATKGRCLCPKGKECTSPGKHPRPDLCPKGLLDATTDQRVIASWPDNINIGVVLGAAAGGVMVFDVDDREVARKLLSPEMVLDDQTGVVFTGRAGCHIWFVVDGDTSTYHVKHADGRKIGEVRGDGAYVVVPPSMGVNGRPYAWRGSVGSNGVPKPTRFQHITDSASYVIQVLREVDTEIAPLDGRQQATASSNVPRDPIYPSEIPSELGKDSRLFNYRTVLIGNVQPSQHDRSGQLFALAQSLAEVAIAKGYTSRETLAGVLKRYDMVAWQTPKYANRTNADEMYWKEICSAFERQGASAVAVATPGDESTSDTSPPVQPPSRRSDYVWDEADGWLYYRGGRVFKKVCSFRPEIIEEREHYHGYGTDNERESSLLVRLTLRGGNSHDLKLPWVDLASSMKLESAITKMCPSQYYLAAGMASHLKAALYDLSTLAPTRRIYTTTGWIEYEDGFAYLLPSALGAITPVGVDVNVQVEEDEVQGVSQLKGYGRNVRPPLTLDEEARAVEAFKTLVDCGPHDKTLPIVMQVMAGPLATAIGDLAPPFVHVSGKTGALKTSFCLAALSLFGQFKSSPASCTSTPTSLQILMHSAKDMTLLLDDYKKASIRDRDSLLATINNLADRTMRLRASATQGLQRGLMPRGLVLSNGEDVWEEEASAQARVIIVDIGRDDIRDRALSLAQAKAEDGEVQLFGGAFISWLAGAADVLDGSAFKALAASWHERLIKTLSERTHRRLVSTVASMMAVASIVRRFAYERFGPAFGDYVKGLNKTLLSALVTRMTAQALDVEAQAPGEQFLHEITTALIQGQAVLRPQYPHRLLPQIPAGPRNAPAVGVWTPISDDDLAPGQVLISRVMTYKWYATRELRTGNQVRFSWHQVRRELLEAHEGVAVQRFSVWVSGRRTQTNGVLLPFSRVLPITESHDG